MLYVFFVGTGTMMTFDMNLAMDTVAALQTAIEKTCGIPVESQVLLVSGGATLDPAIQVCNYGAGMDTNPIFLFAKYSSETDYPSMCYSDSDSEMNMKERVDACGKMAADYQTLTARSQLAREFAEFASQEKRQCMELVGTQHLQQQGWAAVIANLEDTAVAFKRHVELLQNEAQQYFQSRPLYQDLLQKFPEAVDLLAKVPVLRSLTSQCENEDESVESTDHHTLLTRYCTEPRAALEKMAEQCNKWIHQFDEETLSVLNAELRKILHAAEDPTMKEVKGIEDRLFRLNKMMEGAKKLTDDQYGHAEALHKHVDRVCSSNEMSVLSDLCLIHEKQLEEMLKNHVNLKDIRDRCSKAKFELCDNLQARIKWISWIQNEIFNFNNKVAIYRENLRRLIDHLDVIQQIHLAPTIYVKTLAEIHRRKNFSSRFLKWAKNLSEQALELYTKEANLRKAFNHLKTDNFVNNLFPGMDDLPPPFATECPEPFDQLLPNISQEDLEKLKNQLPELACMMDVPPPEQMPHTSHKSVTTDSAFSSEVPSLQTAAPSGSCASLQGPQLFRTETLSSLGAGEGIGSMSPTLSPFEEPFAPAVTMETAIKHSKPFTSKKQDEGSTECKRLHLNEGVAEKEMFSPIVEEQNNVESDGDEFERVDEVPKLHEAFVTCSETSDSNDDTVDKEKHVQISEPVPTNGPQSHISNCNKEDCLEPPLVEERLQSPDSMVTSNDFQSADYFIDDSMPSSYTESTGTGKIHHKVKSHHVILAELQHQVDEKQSALVGTQSSSKMSRSNILLHGKISELQKYVQGIQNQMTLDLQQLRTHVIEQRSTVAEEISDIMQNVTRAIVEIHRQVQFEKEKAVSEAVQKIGEIHEQTKQKDNEKLEKELRNVQEAHSEIERCQRELQRYKILEFELKEECESKVKQMERSHHAEKAEILKRSVLEHELDLENLRDETKQLIQKKENEIIDLTEALSEKQTHIHMLGIERENIEADIKQRLLREQEQWMESTTATFKAKYDDDVKSVLEERQMVQFEEIKMLKNQMATRENELNEHFQMNLLAKLEQQEKDLKVRFDQEKEVLIKETSALLKRKEQELRETASSEYQKEIESMQSRYRLAHSTTSIGRMSSGSSVGSLPSDMPLECSFGSLPSIQGEVANAMSVDKESSDLRKEVLEATGDAAKMADVLNAEQLKLKTMVAKATEEIQKQHEAKVEKLRAQHQAEQQVSFNEALNKIIREKDKVIEDLQCRISYLEHKIGNANVLIKTHYEGDVKRMAASSVEEMQRTGVRSKTPKFDDASRILLEVRNEIDLPFVSALESSFKEDRVQELERELKLEKLKTQSILDQIQKKERVDTVSVLTCDEGDVVLFYYDEGYNNYVAFFYNSVPHFLHPDGLEALSLKLPPQSKIQFALSVVLGKEYCQAKKPGNRYKVAPGSRFYRVKVRSWDQEEARQRSMHGSMGSLLWARSTSASVTIPVSLATAGDTNNSSQMSSSTV